MARHYTLAERAIIYTSIASGLSFEEVNQTLKQEQQRLKLEPREMPESSYIMVKDKYIPKLGLKGLWKQIEKPQSLGSVSKSK